MAEASTFAAPSGPSTSVSTTLNSNISSDRSATGLAEKAGDLLYTYEEEAKRPYAADYLDVKEVWDKEPVLQREVKTIEQFLRQLVVSKKIDNSTKAAKNYLEYMEKEAGIKPYESATRRIAGLLKYIEFREVVDN